MKASTISADLEYGLLSAVARGALPVDVVSEEELSRYGRIVLGAITRLRETAEPPFSASAVLAVAVDVLGAEHDKVRPYVMKVFSVDSGREAADILRAVRARRALIEVINEAGQQLARGDLDAGAIVAKLELEQQSVLVPAAAKVGDAIPERPAGIPIPLEKINAATGGVYGLWVLGGESGVGKSTLALQLAVYLGKQMPVLYYDAENGEDMLLANLGHALGSVDKLKRATERIYIRPTIRTLGTDLNSVRPPALVVVDSVQKFGFDSSKQRRDGIDGLLRRLEGLKKRGYTVLALSEISRADYGRVSNKGYAETRELEYSADMAAQLKGDDTGVVDFHITKNRHREDRGFITSLERVRSWWFKEVSGDEEREF
jgi:hypothetical protein